jgi:hypothetical protein
MKLLPRFAALSVFLLLASQLTLTPLHSQTFTTTGSMGVPILFQTATPLQNGMILIAGLTFRRSRRQYGVNFLASLPTGRPVLERQAGQGS